MNLESGSGVLDKLKKIVHEGNVRHVVVEKDGRRVVDLPLTLIVIAAVVAVWAVAILAIIALLLEYKISIENTEPDGEGLGEEFAGVLDAGESAVNAAAEKVESAASAASDKVKSATDAATGKAKSAADSAAEKVKSATNSAEDSITERADSAATAASSLKDDAEGSINR